MAKGLTAARLQRCIGGAFGNPADLVMVRMQNDAKLPLELQRNYKNAFDGLYQIIKAEGLKGLTRGIGPNMNRAIFMNSSQIASYEQIKQLLLETKLFGDNMQSFVTVFTSTITNEGPQALFKGWVPAFVRLTPHTVVTFMVLEQIKKFYDRRIELRIKATHDWKYH
ncbi:14076_t:CDS:2 [Racocetra fulgida]|uniref:14076_t:CDS:1 n=1 Tax=Racocetra fulgida TaxID=60492 RepID=A0A9N9B1V5_9GLOM|nr:14076_t:CDS:2 [Racocetra fulgida]